jgi:ligand-binding sensor domain-containing protein
MNFKRFFIILLFVVLLVRTLLALSPELAVTQYVIDSWTIDDGLPQNTVTYIIQTHDGYLWIGTGNGIARFDGVKFTIFNMYNSVLKGNSIINLVEDRDENLWIKTGEGISLYKNGQFKNFFWQENRIKLFLDENGSPCILNLKTMDVKRFINDRFEHIYKWKEVFIVDYLFVDKGGNCFFTTNNGVIRFRNNRFEIVKGTEGLNAKSIFIDIRGNLTLLLKDVLVKFKNDGIETLKFTNDLIGSDSGGVIIEDRYGILWMSSQKGLYRYWQGEFKIIKKENGLADSYVCSIYEDREGNLWVGTKMGLSRIKYPRVMTYSTEEGLGCDFPRSIFQDSRGSIWIGGDCDNNLTRIADGKFKVFTKQIGLPERSGVFYEDKNGTLWMGGMLCKFKKGKFELFKTRKGEYIEHIRSIYEDDAGGLWMGTYDGIIFLKDGDITTFTLDNGLSGNLVYELQEDHDNTLWIGTNRGVTLYKDGIFQTVRDASGLAQKKVLEIYVDKEGTVWVGTYGGLYRYQNSHFFLYTMRDGLVDDAILGILEDDKQNLWMSSNHGIFYVNKKELHDFAAGRIDSLHPVSFNRTDGMKSEECNGSGSPSCWKTSDGKLWFPTMKGVVVVDPNRLQLNTQPPPVYIEKVVLDGKPVDHKRRVNVMPGTRRVEFHYTAINFHDPRKVKFRYKLEGHDQQWLEQGPGKERIAPYMNVPGGAYIFRVIACNNDGFWNTKGASIGVKIIPPLHRTWWFKTFMFLFFAVVFYLLVSFVRKYIYLFAFWKKKNYIGQYVIIKLIGCGAMATIFKAHRLLNKKKIAAVTAGR